MPPGEELMIFNDLGCCNDGPTGQLALVLLFACFIVVLLIYTGRK